MHFMQWQMCMFVCYFIELSWLRERCIFLMLSKINWSSSSNKKLLYKFFCFVEYAIVILFLISIFQFLFHSVLSNEPNLINQRGLFLMCETSDTA